jgi:hypothetical protein
MELKRSAHKINCVDVLVTHFIATTNRPIRYQVTTVLVILIRRHIV